MRDASELTAIAQAAAGYNAAIEVRANQLGWAYVDPNPTLVQLRQSEQVPIVPDLEQPSCAFGVYFSLDGVHPAAAAHVLVADLITTAVNAR